MAKRTVQYVILCEDRLQEVFARAYLSARRLNARVRVKVSSPGQGAGEQFVRNSYPSEVATHRGKAAHLNTGLIVFVDADSYSVEERLRQLDDSLDRGRQPDERIAIFVPKRHIETWIRFAAGEDVDEASSYHAFERNESACKPHVIHLANVICRAPLPANAPPSLVTACDELRRIF